MRLTQPPQHFQRFSAWLSLPQLISWGSVFYLFGLLMQPLEAELGLGRAQSSLAFSLCLLAEGAGSWLVGRWIDQGRERLVMATGSVWVALGFVAHTQVHSLAALYAVWVWLGLGAAATLYNPAFALVTRRFPHDFRRAIITITFLGGLASTVFIPLNSWWIALWGWRDTLWLLAALQLLVCLPVHLWLLQSSPPQYPQTAHDAQPVQQAQGSPAQPSHASHTEHSHWRAHLRWPFWLLAAYMVLMVSITTGLAAHMVPLLRESGLPDHWVVLIPAAIGLFQVLGRIVLFVMERQWDVHQANRWISALIPVGLVLLVLVGLHPVPALLFVLLYGMGNGMTTIVKGTAMALYVSRTHVGVLNGLLGLPVAAGRALAPLSLGLLWTPSVGYRYALWWLLLASLLGMAALWGVQRMAQTHAAPTPR
ncbi:MFS transporter [Curvibacter sp. CHRR-16]|nr:MFS transporter [Curvibacter sp. CHRR-16]